MSQLDLYYATNRCHLGKDRWQPSGYGKKFSDDGMENLRFGRVSLDIDDAKVQKHLQGQVDQLGAGDGLGLMAYLSKLVPRAQIQAYREDLQNDIHQDSQSAKLGSAALFQDIQQAMLQSSDVLVFIHGFNVSWQDAVANAAALQLMLNRPGYGDPTQKVLVLLFTWPSDGQALPFTSYRSDRAEAEGSGAAFGRGLLKLRDFLANLRDRSNQGQALCGHCIHLLCHSMGNYLLQHTLRRIDDFTPGNALPRLFEQIFLCAPDVDDTALEDPAKLGRIHELARQVTVYHNKGDNALVISDYTKGNPDRLGSAGAARPAALHQKIQQLDCSQLVHGLVEHSYYLIGDINLDLRHSMDGVGPADPLRRRQRHPLFANVWLFA